MYILNKNERGFTLVELLATLVIAGIILSFVGSLMVKAVNTYDRTATENALRDEADIIMAKINRDVFPLTKDSIVNLETNCANPATNNCTAGSWLLVRVPDANNANNFIQKKIGLSDEIFHSLNGNYEIQNSNIEVIDFKVCYVPTGGSAENPTCPEKDIVAHPTYVFKLTLKNKKKPEVNPITFTNEISIVY